MEEYLPIQGTGNHCSELNTENLETKSWLKITILDEQQPSVQSADKAKVFHV